MGTTPDLFESLNESGMWQAIQRSGTSQTMPVMDDLKSKLQRVKSDFNSEMNGNHCGCLGGKSNTFIYLKTYDTILKMERLHKLQSMGENMQKHRHGPLNVAKQTDL